jgi:hypothetical protein
MELYINDQRVDLSKAIPFPLTYQISDIKDLSARKGASSKTITLPGSRINSNIMVTVFSLTTSDSDSPITVANFDPSQKASARYYQDGILQFEGICKLNECIKKNGVWTFNIVLFAEQIDVVGLLKNFKIRELGWSEYNHNLTALNQSNSWSGIIQKNGVDYDNYSGTEWLGEGYYYGLIDYGFDRASAEHFEVDQIPPQVFIKSIVDKMFLAIGVEYESSFFESQQFKKLLMAYEGGVFPNIDAVSSAFTSIETDQIGNPASYLFDAQGWLTINSGSAPNTWTVAGQNNLFTTYSSDVATVVDPSGQIQSNDPLMFVASASGDYNLNYSGQHDVNLDFTITNSDGSPVIDTKVEMFWNIYINNVIYQGGILYLNETVGGSSLTNSFTASFDLTVDLSLDVSDVVELRFASQTWGNRIVDTTATAMDFSYNVTPTLCELDITYEQQVVQPGANVNIKQFLPDMDCFTFFKGLVTMFNLYTKPVVGEPMKLLINPLNSFYNGSNNALNWTELIDYSKEVKVTPTVNFASKEYAFEFMDDKDYFNERYREDVTKQYGSKSLLSGSQFSKGTTKLKLPFSNKILGEIPTTNIIVPRNFQVKTDVSGISEITPKRGKPFIVQVKAGVVGTLQSGDWFHVNELDVPTALTEYPYVGHLDDLDTPTFDLQFEIPSFVYYQFTAGMNYTTNNLYGFHEKFLRELVDKNGKMLSCSLRLNADTINKLDFGDLINIDGVVYRLQKVSEYNSNDNNSTKTELIRLIEGEGIQTYTIEVPFDEYQLPTKNSIRNTEAGEDRITTDGDDRITE